MKGNFILSFALGLASAAVAIAGDYSPAKGRLSTPWAEKVSPENVWRSYPRPSLRRECWMNLNGLWNYAVTAQDVVRGAVEYEGEILVPFAVESSLSGVGRTFTPEDKLWYSREFELPSGWKGRDVILHFGAVDYECSVWVNGKLAGFHRGGNNAFSLDVTGLLKKDGIQKIEVSVTDPTDAESISRGKQTLNPKGIWYTPVSGIWKTVWLEAVGHTRIGKVQPQSDIASKTVELTFFLENAKGDEDVTVEVYDGGKIVASESCKAREKMSLRVPDAVLWSPETPKLYDFKAVLSRKGRVQDEVSSYFALRQVDVRKDGCGYNRICLNGEPVFQMGTLDQGWWPDGLLTPPSEEAMLWDMVELKKMGFNMIRKHIKVEPELYYHYADSLGLMIWQDMVSGFASSRKDSEHIRPTAKKDWEAPAAHSEQWQGEMFEMIDNLGFYPCITTWVVFNEGWGQHNTKEIVEKVIAYDSTRIVDGVTGWTDRKVGAMYDIHNYPVTSMILADHNDDRVSVLGEFGGYGWSVEGHIWNPEMRNWGYQNIDGAMALMDNYGRCMFDLETLIAQGLSAAVYTQTTDVEGEVNGLITYDRKVVKVPQTLLHSMHSRLYRVQSSKVVTLVGDSQYGGNHKALVSLNGNSPQMMDLPLKMAKDDTACAEISFVADRRYEILSLWLNAAGKVTVRLNGTKVIDGRTMMQTRHYSQFNISDYAAYLKEGQNVIRIEVEASKPMSLDLGLRAF
ncbi:MAG: glycoside hydrolase family 2 protein [Candidatus Cryptobacteroides sp.]